MAVTKGNNKARLDFANAMNQAFQETDVKGKIEEELIKETSMMEDIVVEEVKTKPKVKPSIKEKEAKQTKKEKPNNNLVLEKRLLNTKKQRGYQKSVYFEADVYMFIEALADEYHVKFSVVMNELIKSAMEQL